MDDHVEDKETGISIRFIKQFDAAKEREESLRRAPFDMIRFQRLMALRNGPVLTKQDRKFLKSLRISPE